MKKTKKPQKVEKSIKRRSNISTERINTVDIVYYSVVLIQYRLQRQDANEKIEKNDEKSKCSQNQKHCKYSW